MRVLHRLFIIYISYPKIVNSGQYALPITKVEVGAGTRSWRHWCTRGLPVGGF